MIRYPGHFKRSNKTMRKRTLPILIVLIIGMTIINTPVYAGSINGPEAWLIGQASGTFTYEGRQYKAKETYLSQLRAYLSRDDIDLTQAQANKAASLMYSNIEGGVLDGILEPVGGAPAVDPAQNIPAKDMIRTENAGKADVEISDMKSTIKVKAPDGQYIMASAMPVKNTGFDISGSILALLLLLLCIPLSVIAAWKLNLFDRKMKSYETY